METYYQPANSTTTAAEERAANQQQLLLIFGATSFFLLFRAYLLPAMLQGVLPDTVNIIRLAERITSSVNAMIAIPCTIFYLRNRMSFKHWYKSLNFAKGYLIAGSILDIYYYGLVVKTIVYLVHHVLFFCILHFVKRKPNYAKLTAQGMLAEIPLLLLYYTQYLFNIGQGKGMYFLLLSLVTYLCYFTFRVCNFTCISLNLLKKDMKSETLFFFPLVLMNYYFFYRLTLKAVSIFF
jgi:hypothetical protein